MPITIRHCKVCNSNPEFSMSTVHDQITGLGEAQFKLHCDGLETAHHCDIQITSPDVNEAIAIWNFMNQ